MGKASEDIKAGAGAHAHHASGPDDFISSVRTLKAAEQSAAAMVEDAKKEAAKIEASAREQAVEAASKAQQKAVEAKNEILSKGREQSDKEIHEIMGQARKQSGAIKQKRLSDSEMASLAQL